MNAFGIDDGERDWSPGYVPRIVRPERDLPAAHFHHQDKTPEHQTRIADHRRRVQAELAAENAKDNPPPS